MLDSNCPHQSWQFRVLLNSVTLCQSGYGWQHAQWFGSALLYHALYSHLIRDLVIVGVCFYVASCICISPEAARGCVCGLMLGTPWMNALQNASHWPTQQVFICMYDFASCPKVWCTCVSPCTLYHKKQANAPSLYTAWLHKHAGWDCQASAHIDISEHDICTLPYMTFQISRRCVRTKNLGAQIIWAPLHFHSQGKPSQVPHSSASKCVCM